jgi:argininosuccinate lyase
MESILLQPATDDFQRVHRLNLAAAVALWQSGELSDNARAVAYPALSAVARCYSDDPARWSQVSDYLEIEKLMLEVGGWPITELHSGRSRQDIVASVLRMAWRTSVLDAVAAAGEVRRALFDLAASHPHAVLPAYTWGVQAQPTTLGHYLLGFSQSLARWQQRLIQTYERINQSPLGSCVLGNSLFSLDRNLLASLLGFSGPVLNSFDAVQLATVDLSAEIAGHVNTVASSMSLLYADLTAQYHHAEPWLVFVDVDNVGGSSAMPQKRNPMVLSALRRQQNRMVGCAMTILLNGHNVPSGMNDCKYHEPTEAMHLATSLMRATAAMVRAIRFVPAAAKEELERDYANATDLAHVLQTKGIPFRLAHACVAALVGFARGKGIPLGEVNDAQAHRILAETLGGDHALASSVRWGDVRQAADADWVVQNRKGLGGPQRPSVEAMLRHDVQDVEDMNHWVADRTTRLAAADEELCASLLQLHKEHSV